MSYYTIGVLVVMGLFLAMLLMLEAGRRIGRKRHSQDPDGANAGLGTVEGAIFGLMGLLIAFTFSGAASRFDDRRHLVVEESNAIGTAYLRLDLLPAEAQPMLRKDFREYHGMAGNKARSWLHVMGFAGLIAVSVYIIVDLEFPRFGMIRVNEFDQALVEVRENMK